MLKKFKPMVKTLACWLSVFALSFLVQSWGWAEQGKAFLYIFIGLAIFLVVVIISCTISIGISHGISKKVLKKSFRTLIFTTSIIAIFLLVVWGASKLFGVDFYLTTQIITLGACFCYPSLEKD